MPVPTTYGDVSPRTAQYAMPDFLARAIPYMVIEAFGQSKVVPQRSSKVAKFRRYNALPLTTTPVTEGVTPTGLSFTHTDVTATLEQYGAWLALTDVIQDTHEDPVFMEMRGALAEQAAQTIETIRYNVIKAGTNVFYANGSARTDVNTPLTRTLQRKITRSLKAQNARRITRVLRPTPDYGSTPVAPAFVGIVHTDVEGDIRNMTGYRPPEEYTQASPWPSEIGKVEDVRYVSSTIIEPFLGAGSSTINGMLNSSSAVDVYPVIISGQDAYGIVALRGSQAITPMVSNPKPSSHDPLAQVGTIAWKSMQTAVILNDAWMVRGEVGVTENV